MGMAFKEYDMRRYPQIEANPFPLFALLEAFSRQEFDLGRY